MVLMCPKISSNDTIRWRYKLVCDISAVCYSHYVRGDIVEEKNVKGQLYVSYCIVLAYLLCCP